MKKFRVVPDYGKENVYRIWENNNYPDDTTPEEMDRTARILEKALNKIDK